MGSTDFFSIKRSENTAFSDPIFFALDEKEHFIFVSRGFHALVTKSKESLAGKHIWETFPEVKKSTFYKKYQKAAQTGQSVRFETYYKTLRTWYQVVIEPSAECFEFFINDITALKHQQPKGKFLTVLETIPHMAWTAHPDGYIDYYNQRWYQYTGTTFEQVRDQGWQQVIHPDDLPETLRQWEHSLQTGEKYVVECRYLKADTQEYCWHLTRALPVKNSRGKITMWVGSCTDIDQQKRSIEHLNEARKQLKAMNRELSHKNKELEKTNSDLDQFVYTASHDLKAPIANIEGLTRLLTDYLHEKEGTDKNMETALQMIETSVQRFKTTIIDLTDIAKINKQTDQDMMQVDIQDTIQEAMHLIDDMIHKTGASVEIHTNSCQTIYFSYTNLKSLIYNLVSNAIKYHDPARPPVVRLKTDCHHDQFVLTVQDNGLGIDAKDQGKVFTMFKRMHHHVEGSGVGLFLVKRIVDNAGGTITLESEVGKGSVFTICLRQQ